MRHITVTTFIAIGVTWPIASATAQDAVYVWANQPKTASYSPNEGYTHNPGGSTKIERKGTGRYVVTLDGLGGSSRGGNVQVSSYGPGPNHCAVQQWVPAGNALQVTVRCYAGNGKPVDTQFSMLFTPPPEKGGDGSRYAWAGRPSSKTYDAATQYASNGGRPVRIERRGTGAYVARFDGVSKAMAQGGNVQVSAYGTKPTHCAIVSWTALKGGMDVQIRCYQGTDPSDSAFSVLFTPPKG